VQIRDDQAFTCTSGGQKVGIQRLKVLRDLYLWHMVKPIRRLVGGSHHSVLSWEDIPVWVMFANKVLPDRLGGTALVWGSTSRLHDDLVVKDLRRRWCPAQAHITPF
jgi:hypothetical protein